MLSVAAITTPSASSSNVAGSGATTGVFGFSKPESAMIYNPFVENTFEVGSRDVNSIQRGQELFL